MMLSHSMGTDPVTGEDATNLPIDAVGEIHVRRAAYAPEYGLSSGAVTSVEMRQGGDKWKVTVNDVQPRPRRRDGAIRGIESWTPRFTIGGPLGDKIRLLESVQYEYTQTQVYSLPELQRDLKREMFRSSRVSTGRLRPRTTSTGRHRWRRARPPTRDSTRSTRSRSRRPSRSTICSAQ